MLPERCNEKAAWEKNDHEHSSRGCCIKVAQYNMPKRDINLTVWAGFQIFGFAEQAKEVFSYFHHHGEY